MPDSTRITRGLSTTAKAAGLFGFIALTSTVAFGLPWDIDMADSQAVKAYEYQMADTPEGIVPQDHALTPGSYTQNYILGTPEGNALQNPVEKTEASLATGERMYEIYCTACHGNGVVLNENVAKNYPGIAILWGDAQNARARQIPDGRLYLTIRNGYGLMPAYGKSMDDTEMWSLVHYIRQQPKAQYNEPTPEPSEESPE
jgi:mono/diheme cytochrome c family protein